MKLSSKYKKKLSAIQKALKRGLPVIGLASAIPWLNACDKTAPLPGDVSQQEDKRPESCIVSIDPMSLYRRRFTTAGIMYPLPMQIKVKKYKVQLTDSWQSLAEKYGTTLEIMLRINEIPVPIVYQVMETGKIPEDQILTPEKTIYVPVMPVGKDEKDL